ncbi:hypothetical protein [Pseudoduganella sp. GCM10020061]|uniref:hypothetical protein n=1 Tax=Pseudoduganella sp. GCM10020061 TaxID=3317345 RepID=UPI0036411D29
MTKTQNPADEPDHDVDDEAAVRALTDLALECARKKAEVASLQREVRKHLLKKHDDVLYDAIEEARDMADGTHALLRETVEESASTVLLRSRQARGDAPDMEINAFAIPLFVRSTGGLRAEQGFEDQQAYEQLLDSFTAQGLESPDARVVLIQHWYDLAEMDRISYASLHEIVREVANGMDERKVKPMPALERSMSGWDSAPFAPDDEALELRFLLGFSLKRVDDKFYAVPKGEAQADDYFERRMERYRAWTAMAEPLLARLLAPGREIEISFLYQDLFHGAKEQGANELFMLRMMAGARALMEEGGIDPGSVGATVSAADEGHVVRAELRDASGAVLATFDRPLDAPDQLEAVVDDVADALASIGIRRV